MTVYEPAHDKIYKWHVRPANTQNQPRHPPSLISLRYPLDESLGPWLPIERRAKTLISLNGCPGLSVFLLDAHAILLVLSCTGSFVIDNMTVNTRNKISCVPREDSDQPAHSRSLIRIFTGRILDSQTFKVSSCGQRRLSDQTARVRMLIRLRWGGGGDISEGTFSHVAVDIGRAMRNRVFGYMRTAKAQISLRIRAV